MKLFCRANESMPKTLLSGLFAHRTRRKKQYYVLVSGQGGSFCAELGSCESCGANVAENPLKANSTNRYRHARSHVSPPARRKKQLQVLRRSLMLLTSSSRALSLYSLRNSLVLCANPACCHWREHSYNIWPTKRAISILYRIWATFLLFYTVVLKYRLLGALFGQQSHYIPTCDSGCTLLQRLRGSQTVCTCAIHV